MWKEPKPAGDPEGDPDEEFEDELEREMLTVLRKAPLHYKEGALKKCLDEDIRRIVDTFIKRCCICGVERPDGLRLFTEIMQRWIIGARDTEPEAARLGLAKTEAEYQMMKEDGV